MAERVGSGMDGPGVLAVGIKIAGALESAHRRNLIHGDLRPEDILVTDDGEPHIADLGVALVTGLGPDRATTRPASPTPRPSSSQTTSRRSPSDVYALGSVLYALLAGAPAFVQPGDTVATRRRPADRQRPAARPAADRRPGRGDRRHRPGAWPRTRPIAGSRPKRWATPCSRPRSPSACRSRRCTSSAPTSRPLDPTGRGRRCRRAAPALDPEAEGLRSAAVAHRRRPVVVVVAIVAGARPRRWR